MKLARAGRRVRLATVVAAVAPVFIVAPAGAQNISINFGRAPAAASPSA